MQRPPPLVEIALDAQATIGEAPLWSAFEQALYWIDVKKPALYRFEPTTGALRSWGLTSDVGGFALLRDAPGALVALRYGLHRLDFASGALTLLAKSPFDPRLFRFNEGACDASGRFWIGVMFDPLEPGPERRKGALHSFTFAGGLKAEADASELHNGMAWSRDGRIFYLSHSYQQRIFAHSYDAQTGAMGEGSLLATLPQDLGIVKRRAIGTPYRRRKGTPFPCRRAAMRGASASAARRRWVSHGQFSCAQRGVWGEFELVDNLAGVRRISFGS